MTPRRVLLLAALLAAVALPARGGALQDLRDALRTPPPGPGADEGTGVVLSGRLSRADAVKLALTHNLALRHVVEEREVARGRVLESWAEALPEVNLDARYERVANETGVEIPSEVPGADPVLLQFGFLDNYSADLSLTQPLYKGGRARAALRASRLYRAYADEQVRTAVQEAAFAAGRAYEDVLLSEEQVRVASNYLKLSESHLKDTQTRQRFGVASNFNVLRSQVDVSNARVQLVRYENQLHVNRTELFRILGVSQRSEVELSDRLEYVPRDLDEDPLVQEALRARPELAAAHLEVNLRQEAVEAARADYKPEVNLFFTNTWAKPDPEISNLYDLGSTWRAGVTLHVPVFDGFRRRGILAQERARQRQAEISYADRREQVLAEVRRAVLTVRDARQAVEAQRLTVGQAEEGLRLAEVGYREGTLDQVAVLDARAALTQAQAFYAESLHAHSLAQLAVDRAVGALGSSEPQP